jgi:(p)ppGpp synthase/HD superfamily hydrolase
MTAKDFAFKAHADHAYGEHPYSVHLEEVAELVREVDPSPLAEDVAYLHDVLEDCDHTKDELEELFGADVADAVHCVTDPPGHNRKTRKQRLHGILAGLDPKVDPFRVALLVKAADRLANVRSCVKLGDKRLGMYRKEHPTFRIATFREGICDVIWTELDELLS